MFNLTSSLFLPSFSPISLLSYHSLLLLYCSLFLLLSFFLFFCQYLTRWPFLLMAFWPPLGTRKRITPCWAPMTSSTLEEAPTQRTCRDHRSATTSWDALKTWVLFWKHSILSVRLKLGPNLSQVFFCFVFSYYYSKDTTFLQRICSENMLDSSIVQSSHVSVSTLVLTDTVSGDSSAWADLTPHMLEWEVSDAQHAELLPSVYFLCVSSCTF